MEAEPEASIEQKLDSSESSSDVEASLPDSDDSLAVRSSHLGGGVRFLRRLERIASGERPLSLGNSNLRATLLDLCPLLGGIGSTWVHSSLLRYLDDSFGGYRSPEHLAYEGVLSPSSHRSGLDSGDDSFHLDASLGILALDWARAFPLGSPPLDPSDKDIVDKSVGSLSL